jgi:hypothetical protein
MTVVVKEIVLMENVVVTQDGEVGIVLLRSVKIIVMEEENVKMEYVNVFKVLLANCARKYHVTEIVLEMENVLRMVQKQYVNVIQDSHLMIVH